MFATAKKENREPTVEEFEQVSYLKLFTFAGEDIKSILVKLVGKDLSRVVCIALDTPANRKVAKVEDDTITDDKDGFEYSPGMFSWIRSELTLSQEPEVLKAIAEVNDFGALLKNYLALVVGAMAGESGKTTKGDSN
jgi:hypothetical protein